MQSRILRIGLTGNIGSGKSTVARIFECLDIPVYYADQRAKSLMINNEAVREQIIAAFGPESYVDYRSSKLDQEAENAAIELNRAYLAEKVFNDENQLKVLNAIVHPAVAADALAWHEAQKGVPYTLYEAAITFETGGYKVLDKVIVVTASEATRLQRVINRDNVNEAQVKARMDKQWPEEKKAGMADFLIDNEGTQPLLPQVLEMHRQLVKLSNSTDSPNI